MENTQEEAKIVIHPYVRGSESARNLRDNLEQRGHHTVILHRKPMRPRARIVSWGAKDIEYDLDGLRVLNHPRVTAVFSNKLKFFRQVGEDFKYSPLWTANKADAQTALNAGQTIVERHKLSGKSGEGIRIVEPGNNLQDAPLYVVYQKKTDEYRVHVFKSPAGEFYVGHHQKKVAAPGAEIQEWKIRNHDNGFIFQQHGYELPDLVSSAALGLVRDYFSEIDFVALDVIYHDGRAPRAADRIEPVAKILEGNTAPGIEGTSVDKYAEFLLGRFA